MTMNNNIVRSIFALALISCVACNKSDICQDLPNGGLISYCAEGVEGVDETKATLVTSNNLSTQYPKMTVHAMRTGTNTQIFQDEFTPSSTAAVSLNQYWREPKYDFYSYPKDAINPTFANQGFSFDYTIKTNSTDTPDIVVARTTCKRGNNVQFYYKHIFTAVNVIYNNPGIGHRISSIKVKNAYTTGTCTIDKDQNISWSNQGTKSALVDTKTRGITYEKQVVTEDGCKFMVIPEKSDDDGKIEIEVVIDGITVTKTSENKSGAGDIVNFYINDNFDITTTPGAQTDGSVTKNADGTYKMTLEAFVTGEYKSSTITKTVATDYILVLDNSSSMTWDMSGHNGTPKRIELLREAASEFVDDVITSATTSGVQHRISVVSFGKPEYPGGSTLRKTYATPGSSNYLAETPITSSSPGTLTQVLKQWTTDLSSVKTAINSMDANGNNTASAMGMELAWQLYQSKREGAVPVVIFFTDGQPENTGGSTSDWTALQLNVSINGVNKNTSICETADQTIEVAKKFKSAGVEIFTIGIFSSSTNKELCKNYCETVSSNYPNATGLFSGTFYSSYSYMQTTISNVTIYSNTNFDTSKRGSKRTDGKNYYHFVDSKDALKEAFKSIQVTIVTSHPAIDIHEDAYVKTIISDAFKLPAGYNTSSSVKFYTVAQTGYNASTKKFSWSSTKTDVTSSMTATFDSATQTFKVSGFDYAANFCVTSGTKYGKKLVMVFDNLPVNPDRPAGANQTIVYTSGLYDDDDQAIAMYDPNNMKVTF